MSRRIDVLPRVAERAAGEIESQLRDLQEAVEELTGYLFADSSAWEDPVMVAQDAESMCVEIWTIANALIASSDTIDSAAKDAKGAAS